jgi:hypothetical protein
MDRIKSALEIALEKTAHLERASAEELRRQKEEELVTLSKGIVQKYLRGEYTLKDVASALERHPERELMAQALWEQLMAAISLENCEAVFEGLEFLAADKEAVRKATARAKEISQDCRLEKEHRLHVLKDGVEQSIRQELFQHGIAGSSVEIDVESAPQWRQGLQELEAFSQTRLELVKKSLNQSVPISHNLLLERHNENR